MRWMLVAIFVVSLWIVGQGCLRGRDCRVDDDCLAGQICRQGFCLDRSSLRATGAVCRDKFDCLSGVCAQGLCASLVQPTESLPEQEPVADSAKPDLQREDASTAEESSQETVGEIIPEQADTCDLSGCVTWTTTGGGLSRDSISDLTVDKEGNIYITGQMAGSIKFGSVLAEAWAQKDAYVAKFDAQGNVLWAYRFGGTLDDKGAAITVDSRGYVTIAGEFRGTIGTNPRNLVSHGSDQEDIFIAHFSPKGSLEWAHAITGPGADGSRALAVDSKNNIYLVGAFYYTSSFQGANLRADHNYSAFVTKIAPNGSFQWTRQTQGIDFELAEAITIDSQDNITIAGTFQGGATFGTTSLKSKGSGDFFVARLDTEGNWLWARNHGGPGGEKLTDLVTDAKGDLYAAVNCAHNSILGSTTLELPVGNYACVVKLDSAGKILWVKHSKEPTLAAYLKLAVDAQNNVYFSGSNDGPLAFGEHSVPLTPKNTDGFVAALSADGTWQWVHGLVGKNVDVFTNLAVGKDNSLIVTGIYSDQAIFQWFSGRQSSEPLSSLGDWDVFLLALQLAK